MSATKLQRELERRMCRETELRAVADGNKRVIEGCAAAFNSLSNDLGGFRERILPGAFTRTLRSSDARCTLNHDPSSLLGRQKSGTFRLWESDSGLMFRCEMPDTQVARDVYTSIQRGDISACSFSFRADADEWTTEEIEGRTVNVRLLRAVTLYEAGPVAFPAYDATSVQVASRALALARQGKPQVRQDDEEGGDDLGNINGCMCDCPGCQDDDCQSCNDPSCDDPECAAARTRAEMKAHLAAVSDWIS